MNMLTVIGEIVGEICCARYIFSAGNAYPTPTSGVFPDDLLKLATDSQQVFSESLHCRHWSSEIYATVEVVGVRRVPRFLPIIFLMSWIG